VTFCIHTKGQSATFIGVLNR